ncbi:MAG: trifunctional transcriptional activator/DNA repair protein Ada/methylated-DNA--[protein]-cysteine S-methyltransferase [Verrucomicrobiales bacterium]
MTTRSRPASASPITRKIPPAVTTVSLPNPDTMYEAIVNRDASYEGLFVMGVRTTGIFCRPTCPARRPRRENVEFFPRAGDALAAGYRPCQRCRPLDAKGSTPDWLQPLLDAVEADPRRRWTMDEVADFGVAPARVRRWFQTHHGMTFLAYLRARRLGQAFSRIRDGAKVLESAMDADFDSVSGFCEALRRATGRSPRELRGGAALQVAQISSPLGPIMLAGDESAVHLVEFRDRRMLETQFTVLEKRLGVVFFPGQTDPMRAIADELTEYFAGDLRNFNTAIAFPGSAHQQQVWRALLRVPYGETRSYGELAASLGRASAVRAVGRAVGENRLAIVLPCHRIVGADGQLTGYGGGLWRKRFLLAHEGGTEPGRPL